jgi:hypothetical protein
MSTQRSVYMKKDIAPDLKGPCMPLYPAFAGGSVKGFEARTKSQMGVVHKLNAQTAATFVGLTFCRKVPTVPAGRAL